MGRVTARTPIVRLDAAARTRVERPDTLAVEEPLEVRVRAGDGSPGAPAEPVVVTMRTPGDDLDLALGFLLTEGLLTSVDDVATALHCTDLGEDGVPTFNVLEVTLRPGVPPLDLAGRRTFGMTSACGVCGSASIDAVQRRSAFDVDADADADATRVDLDVLVSLPERLRAAQAVFARTGGLHAAGLFTPHGDLLVAAEDVGRHNAVDKVLGGAARTLGWPLRGTVLQVSGRASFELVQKAWCAGVPVLSAVSAPSSLAVALAQRAGMTLAGFVRDPRCNLYAGSQRVVTGAEQTLEQTVGADPGGRGTHPSPGMVKDGGATDRRPPGTAPTPAADRRRHPATPPPPR